MEIIYTKRFSKHYKKLDTSFQRKTKDAIEIFSRDPYDHRLRNHQLQGGYAGYWSLDVTGDLRIIFHELGGGSYEIVELVDVGTHSQLYG